MWFKTFMSDSIVWFKRPDNKSRNINWKILLVRERKWSGNFNSLPGYQYRICKLKHKVKINGFFCVCFNAIFSNISAISGLYNATKTRAFASYFSKMRVKILYW
jgi:hypothetical protein